jgi:DGQHR domain-containing protein
MSQAELSVTEGNKDASFRALRITQPIGEFFVGTIDSKILCQIADFDVRRILRDERDVERYLGIQRPLNSKRVSDLEKYVNFVDAAFPTSIIVAIREECAEFDETRSTLTVRNVVSDDPTRRVLWKEIARVIDGQHRIAGLYKYNGPRFEVNVTVFVGMDIAEQAHVFATVNLEQTKVSKSLAYDLFELAKSRSPQKTGHNVAVALDQSRDSPFYQRIKRLGTSTEGRFGETLTQATFVEALLPLISADPKYDRDRLLRQKVIPLATADELDKTPFRNLFIKEQDVIIANIMWNYFEAVRSRWPEAWGDGSRGAMLNKSNGFRALMRVFRRAYLRVARPGEEPKAGKFKVLLDRVNLEDQEFNVDRYKPGMSGESDLARDLRNGMGLA